MPTEEKNTKAKRRLSMFFWGALFVLSVIYISNHVSFPGFLPRELLGIFHLIGEIFKDIGIAFLVAVIITWFWQLEDFTEFFTEFSSSILVNNKYLEKLNISDLKKLRQRTVEALIGANATNASYEALGMSHAIDEVFFSWLPDSNAEIDPKENEKGVYRKSYDSNILITPISFGRAVDESVALLKKQNRPDEAKKLSETNFSPEQKAVVIFKINTHTSYVAISPLSSKKNTSYVHNWDRSFTAIPGIDESLFPVEARYFYRIKIDGMEFKSLRFKKNNQTNRLEFDSEQYSFSPENGEVFVSVESTEYMPARIDNSYLITMRYLTYGARVEVRQRRSDQNIKLKFDASVVAPRVIKNKVKTFAINDGKIFILNDWFLEGNGFYFEWWDGNDKHE